MGFIIFIASSYLIILIFWIFNDDTNEVNYIINLIINDILFILIILLFTCVFTCYAIDFCCEYCINEEDENIEINFIRFIHLE